MIGLNCGSGQRKFDRAQGWWNLDIQPRWEPDVLANWNDLSMFESGKFDYVVAHHTIEHVGCGEADQFISEAYRVLRKGGSLLVFVPDMRALARRFLMHSIDDFTFFVNVYGAYMGDEADRHKWGYTFESLHATLIKGREWSRVGIFDWRPIPGADIAKDWWILGMEAVK